MCWDCHAVFERRCPLADTDTAHPSRELARFVATLHVVARSLAAAMGKSLG